MSSIKEKMKAVASAIAAIEKQFGKGAIMSLDGGEIEPIGVIPTGSVGLDVALGVGGLPRGRVIEIYGPESSGKTTLTLQAIAQAQRAGGVCAFIDAEHALDVGYARKLGVRTEELLVSQPDHGEQALEIADKLVATGAVDLIVIDSVAALVPKAEIEGEMGDAHMGLQARLMSQALRKLTAATAKNNTTVIFINQLRQKIGVVYGNPETTTGGNALKFYASVRLDIRKIGVVKNGDQLIGNHARVKVVKNKVPRPFARPSSTSSTASASTPPARSSTWRRLPASSKRRAPSIRSAVNGSARDATRPALTSPSTPRSPRRSGGSCWRPARRRTPPSARR
jgi:recombination protein RecA